MKKRRNSWLLVLPGILLVGIVLVVFPLVTNVLQGSKKSHAAAACNWPVLQAGSSGENVFSVQYFLRANGATLSPDGIYGPQTADAVQQFQSAQGLAQVDGIVGAETFPALVNTALATQGTDFATALQRQLNAQGANLTVNGVLDSNTQTAVQQFQTNNGLTADGIAGTATWCALVGGMAGGATNNPNTGNAGQNNPGANGGNAATQAGNGCTTPGTTTAQLASQILATGNVTFLNVHPSGVNDNATAATEIQDAANGQAVQRSSYGTAPGGTTTLKPAMLAGLLAAACQHKLEVTEMAGGSHSAGSLHYQGVAFDVDMIDGQAVSPNSNWNVLRQSCLNSGATHVFDPAHDPGGHQNHVHCDWG